MLANVLTDIRYGIRQMVKAPGFTIVAVLTLAFGIGATAAVFKLIQGVLLTPPPYRQSEQLVIITSVRADGKEMSGVRSWPAGQWLDWQTQGKSLVGIAGYAWTFNFLILP